LTPQQCGISFFPISRYAKTMSKREVRFFNTTGPCNPDDHYMLPPEERLVGAQLHRYIKDKLYWVLHAPRQTGKTTFLQSWMKEINAIPEGAQGAEAISCYVTVERCQGISEPEKAMPAICHAIQEFAGSGTIYAPGAEYTDDANITMYAQWISLTPCRYVRENGSGSKNGLSWANASDDLQKMMDELAFLGDSVSGKIVYAGAGTYTPKYWPGP
jgi:hypothetical protein